MTIDSMNDFIIRYRIFTDGWAKNRLADFKIGFPHIRVGMDSIAKLTREIDRRTAGDYNVFRASGISGRELSHSAFLANLFKPNGTHGQGDLFLRHFLQFCCDEGFFGGSPADFSGGYWIIETEKQISDDRRLDIVFSYLEKRISDDRHPASNLSCLEKRILVVIENKIYAGEQHRQIPAYKKWMDSQKNFLHRALIYLTPDGKLSGTATSNDDCKEMSYRKDVANILRMALPEIQAPRVVSIVQQYLQLIQTL